jgi:DNA-binding FadR family transcriptional regulator
VSTQPLGGRVDDALFRPVRAGNAFEETVERLLQAIKLGVVEPGERLPSERDLAGRFNVSRVTLREAIKALQDAGYVESRRGRYGGTFVQERLPRRGKASVRRLAREMASGLDDALVFRRVLEVGAAEAAALRVPDDYERAHLTQRLEQCTDSRESISR